MRKKRQFIAINLPSHEDFWSDMSARYSHLLFIACAIQVVFTKRQTLAISTTSLNRSRTHTFYICRHGETDANASGVIQGSSDFSRLTGNGKNQAKILGLSLQNNDDISLTNHVFISPLSRAKETWDVVKTTMNEVNSEKLYHNTLSVRERVLEDLREIDFYAWEGMHKNEVKEQYPDSYAAWKAGDPDGLFVPHDTGLKYPLLDLWNRATKVWNEIHQLEVELLSAQSNGGDSSSLLVCHGSLGQALLGSALGFDANFFREEPFPNCGMAEIEWSYFSDSNSFGEVYRWRWFRPTLGDWNYNS